MTKDNSKYYNIKETPSLDLKSFNPNKSASKFLDDAIDKAQNFMTSIDSKIKLSTHRVS